MSGATPDVDFQAYGRWAEKMWLSDSLEDRDYAIMGLGLMGEYVEMLDALDGCALDKQASELLIKELGDVVYYAARLARAFDIELVLPNTKVQGFAPQFARNRANNMVRPLGRISELLKKFIRDGASGPAHALLKSNLMTELSALLKHWCEVCAMCEVPVESVLAANREKLESRLRRGTLQGSGDER